MNLKQLARYAVDKIEKGSSSKTVSKQLAAVLVEQRRSRDAAELMRLIETELARRGRTQIVVTSAHPVSETVKRELAKALSVEKPIFHEEVDSSVIGGVAARTLEKEIDLTIRAKLYSIISQVKENK